jgi:hypothetical protein
METIRTYVRGTRVANFYLKIGKRAAELRGGAALSHPELQRRCYGATKLYLTIEGSVVWKGAAMPGETGCPSRPEAPCEQRDSEEPLRA